MWRRWPVNPSIRNLRRRKFSSGGRRRFVALWGNGDHGRLGTGSLESRRKPTFCRTFNSIDDPPRAVACGGAHTLFLTEKGRVYATGLNDFGQLGVPSQMSHSLVPHEVLGLSKEISKISAGYHCSSAITVDGELYMWGSNSSGQLGLGRRADKIISKPARVEYLAGLHTEMVALGSDHAVAVTDEGVVLSWGAGNSGRLGHGPQSNILGFLRYPSEYTPRVIKDLEGVKVNKIAAGLLHTACVSEQGRVLVFGERMQDKLLFGASMNATPSYVLGEVPSSEEVACGGYHTCILTKEGELYTWGSNENGCLGLGCVDPVRLPEKIESSLLRYPIMEVSCGWKHTAVICGGNVFSWGWGGSYGTFSDDGHSSGGQLGHDDDVDYDIPTQVMMEENVRALQVSCGFNHTAAIFEYI